MTSALNRRQFLAATTAAAFSAAEPAKAAVTKKYQSGVSPWPICLDTATIRPASLKDKVRIAAETGYDAIEPWDRELREYEEDGGDLEALGQEIRDRGLFVPSVIGLWGAIPANEAGWNENLEATRDRMRMASAVGAEHVQVIPTRDEFDLAWGAECYRRLLDMGINDYNINPALVFVEFLPKSRRMGQASAMAIDANHPKAKIIPDVFHMYIGDSGFNGLKHLNGDFIAIFQFNDAPAAPSKENLEDKHRVYPGDGILPLEQCLRDLVTIGYKRCVSLELYNPSYWEQDLKQVADTGKNKTLEVIAAALA